MGDLSKRGRGEGKRQREAGEFPESSELMRVCVRAHLCVCARAHVHTLAPTESERKRAFDRTY